MFRMLTGATATRWLARLNYDAMSSTIGSSAARFVQSMGIDQSECLMPIARNTKLRAVFERKIRYWERRPMPKDKHRVVSPSDARMLFGSFPEQALLPVKHKFFDLEELLGYNKAQWIDRFSHGDWAIFRLTPEKYHYNHVPVSGQVADLYQVDGRFHSCNPYAVITEVTPHSKNRRHVTIIDTDVFGGTQCGYVAMIEVVALMIGEIVQCYSDVGYEDPVPIEPGQFLTRGAVKSLFRPGSSTVILLFERGRVRFDDDLCANARRTDVFSQFVRHFQEPLVETDVRVRSSVATAVRAGHDANAQHPSSHFNVEAQR